MKIIVEEETMNFDYPFKVTAELRAVDQEGTSDAKLLAAMINADAIIRIEEDGVHLHGGNLATWYVAQVNYQEAEAKAQAVQRKVTKALQRYREFERFSKVFAERDGFHKRLREELCTLHIGQTGNRSFIGQEKTAIWRAIHQIREDIKAMQVETGKEG